MKKGKSLLVLKILYLKGELYGGLPQTAANTKDTNLEEEL